MNKFLLLLLLPLFSLAQKAPDKAFKLKGQLNLVNPVDWVYLRYSSGDQLVYDSLQTKDGSFKFEGKIEEPLVASLMVKFVKQPGEDKAQRDFTQLFLEPGKMEIVAKDSLKTNSVTGSAGYVDFITLINQQQPYRERVKRLYESYNGARNRSDKDAMKKIENEIELVNNEMLDNVFGNFVRTHPNSPVALYALTQYAGWVIDAAKIEPLFNSLPEATRQLPSAIALKNQVDISRKTAIGNYALDFTQNDTLGNPVSLSSFRGKYVLVDFWASWCGPCRQENPNVVKAFNKYRDKNFTVLSVSLDRPNGKDKWMKAIHDDGLAWNHVSDLKFWDNEAAKLYGIRAIPQNLLLDPQGKIIAKNLSGDELENKLGEVLD